MQETRLNKISSEYQRAMADAVRSLKDPRIDRGLVSVVRCDVTGDLRYAKVYISVLGSDEDAREVMRAVNTAAGFLRKTVSAAVSLRSSPEPIFYLDESIRRGADILKKINELDIKQDDE